MMKSILFFTVLNVCFFSLSQSDDCAGVVPSLAVGSSCTPTAFNVSAGFADNFSNEPPCATNYRDGFFQFTATTSSSTVSLTDPAGGGNAGLMVLSGTCGGTLTVEGCSETGDSSPESVSFGSVPGQVYFIVIFRSNNAGGGDLTGTICVTESVQGSVCESGETLPFDVTLCNTNSFSGTFPDDGSAPINNCDDFFNDGEYWYEITGTGTQASVNITGLTNSWSGVFIYDDCPLAGGNCIAYNSSSSTTPYSATTPVLTLGQTYYIVIANWSTPYQTDFCITVTETQSAVVASDCIDYVDICTDFGFQIDPNGFGAVNEIPAPGSFGNPLYGDGSWDPINPWGSGNEGCLQIGESNSTWMVINISGSGDLEFSFGAGGAQAGYYDWIMYPFTNSTTTCSAIAANTLAPVRCNWNWANFGGTGLASTIPAGGDPGNYEPPLSVVAGQQYVICFSNYSSATSNVPLNFGGTATVSCTPLGVDFLSFNINGDCSESSALLEWQTENEVNHNYFEILKSDDAVLWKPLGRVYTFISSEDGKNNYEFKDTRFYESAYFRLKQVDIDGKETLTDIKRVSCSESIKLNSLAPNPAKDQTILTFMSKSEGSLTIMDQTGRTIDQIVLENTKGKITKKPIDVSKYESGTYLFVIEVDGKRSVERLIK